MAPAVSVHVLPASHMGLKSSTYGLQQFTQVWKLQFVEYKGWAQALVKR